MSDEGIFDDVENDFGKADKAEPLAAPGYVYPGTYQVVCVAIDPKGDGKIIDHDAFEARTHTKGFKLFFEILSPEKVRNEETGEEEETKGKVVEHVFWVSKDNAPYVKRDIASILGRELESLKELHSIAWAGKTCEIGVKDDTYQGFLRSKVAFINAWAPEKDKEKKETSKDSGSTKKVEAGKKSGGVDF